MKSFILAVFLFTLPFTASAATVEECDMLGKITFGITMMHLDGNSLDDIMNKMRADNEAKGIEATEQDHANARELFGTIIDQAKLTNVTTQNHAMHFGRSVFSECAADIETG